MDSLSNWLPLISALVAVGIQWGVHTATLRAFRREVDELSRVVRQLTSVEMRVALLEQTVKRIDEIEIPKIEKELTYQHDKHGAAIAAVRAEIADCRNTRTAHD